MQQQRVPELDQHVDDGSRSARDEIERIVRSATIWSSVGVLAPAIVLGPLLAAGWRPARLPVGLEDTWWAGMAVAAIGLGMLIWAGCPALGDDLRSAYQQKMQTVRFGIVLNVAGLAAAALAVVLSPA